MAQWGKPFTRISEDGLFVETVVPHYPTKTWEPIRNEQPDKFYVINRERIGENVKD